MQHTATYSSSTDSGVLTVQEIGFRSLESGKCKGFYVCRQFDQSSKNEVETVSTVERDSAQEAWEDAIALAKAARKKTLLLNAAALLHLWPHKYGMQSQIAAK